MATQPVTYSSWTQKDEWDKYVNEDLITLQVEGQDQRKNVIKGKRHPVKINEKKRIEKSVGF